MKAFVISLLDNDYSQLVTARCLLSSRSIGLIDPEIFEAIDSYRGASVMQHHGLKWTWANNNASHAVCPITKLNQHPYGKLAAKIGCSMSHYLLWLKCLELNEPILVLEHDAVFIREFIQFEFTEICQINDPCGATPHGKDWRNTMLSGPSGVSKKSVIFNDRPDGLAGNSAYVVKPKAAAKLVNAFKVLGVWPNDATMCRQLFDLEQYFPFITRVEQSHSTTS